MLLGTHGNKRELSITKSEMSRLNVLHQALWRKGRDESEQCEAVDIDLSPYDTGALVSMEAVYWLQLLDIEGGGPRHRELRHALPLALAATVACIIAGQEAANAVLVVLPMSMSVATTLSRLSDRLMSQRRRHWLCAWCRTARNSASNEEMGLKYSG